MKKRALIVATLCCMPVLVENCANDTEFKRTVGHSSSAISIAEDAGANKIPSASIYLQLAKQELDQSKDLVTAHNYEEATSLLLRAEVDAELALALSQEDSQKTDASEAMSRVRRQKKETESPKQNGENSL